MGDEQIKNSTFLESNNQLEDLKLQVLNIEHNYITVSDLDNYVTSSELHNYVTSYDFENTNVEIYNLKNKSNILSSKIDELEKIDLSVYVTNNQLEEKLNLMDKKLSDMSTYTKTEIDDKFSNINVNVDLSDYVKKSELPNTSNYLTSSELNIILDNKNYLTSHQSLDEYVKKSELTNEIDERISSEYESIQNLYDNKIDKFKETYLSTINELGYVTNDDVKNIVDTSLMEYVDNERLEHVIKNIDFINSSTLHDYVEKYVSSKLISDNYITNKDIDEYVKNNIPTKTSQLFNDSGYLTKHQSLDGYVKDSELSKYISRDEFLLTIKDIESFDTSIFLTQEDLKGYVKEKDIPTKTSQLFNDSGYLTKHQSLEEYVKKSDMSKYVLTEDIDKKIIDVVSDIDISDKIPSIDLSDYAKKSDIPVKISELINDKGYLTSHQSLKDYVKKSDLVDFVTESELDEVKKALKYVSLKDDIKEFAKKSDVPTKTSQLFNDSGYLTKHQSLDGYVKDSELSKYISRDEFENRINSLDIIDDLEKYLTKDDIKNIAYVSDIPTKLSDMFNDVGYLTKHQSLDGYVKKSDTDIFVTKPEIDDIIEKINTIKLEGFVTQNELKGYATKKDIIAQIIKHKQDLSNFVKSDDLEQFVKKTSIPNYDDFVRTVDLPDMSRYLLKDDINSFGFITLKDIPNVYKIVNDSLVSYVKSKEFNDYKKNIDKKQYQSKTDVINILDDYVKKSEIFEISGLDKNLVENMINNEISKIHVPSNLSELKNDVGYLTKHQSLSGYVKRHEISDFITISEANKTYLRINDFKLPDDIVYKSDIKDTVTKQDLMNVTKGFINKSQLNEYLMKPEFNKELSNIRENILGQLNDIKEIKSNITNINNLLSSNSENIVDKTTLEDYVNYKSFDEYKNKFSDDLTVQKQMLRELNEKISEQKTWTSINFVRKNELSENGGIISGGNNSEIDINENVIRTLLDAIRPKLEPELESRFLLKEDYRGIKSAATINFGYNEYPDLFFKVMNNTSNIMINDGFYVVEEKAYIVRNNQIIPICDRKSPHWEIETTDENWEVELTKKEIHDLLDIPYDEEEKEESNEQSE